MNTPLVKICVKSVHKVRLITSNAHVKKRFQTGNLSFHFSKQEKKGKLSLKQATIKETIKIRISQWNEKIEEKKSVKPKAASLKRSIKLRNLQTVSPRKKRKETNWNLRNERHHWF